MSESAAFYRRCRRRQPVLSAIQAGVAFLLGMTGIVDLTAEDPPDGLSGAQAFLCLALLVCFVLLVRRDEPDLDV